MSDKSYRFAGIDVAMQILRPGATFEISGVSIVNWNDPRPQPTSEEILNMVEQIKKFEEQQVLYVTVDGTEQMVAVDSRDFFNGE